MELRKRRHGERHRVHGELDHIADAVNAGVDPYDLVEPGEEYKPETVRDHQLARRGRGYWLRHWKTKEWKRRKVNRSRRNRLTGEHDD
jgi:hypothetical protein